MNLFVYEKLEEERQGLPFGNVTCELHSYYSYPCYCEKTIEHSPRIKDWNILFCSLDADTGTTVISDQGSKCYVGWEI